MMNFIISTGVIFLGIAMIGAYITDRKRWRPGEDPPEAIQVVLGFILTLGGIVIAGYTK